MIKDQIFYNIPLDLRMDKAKILINSRKSRTGSESFEDVLMQAFEAPPTLNSKPTRKKKSLKRSYRIFIWEKPNYKHTDLLLRSISDQGKILSTRLTRADVKQQREITKSVKQARVLGLLPFVHKEYDRSRL
jgi:small subunit ribosomal protein S18